MLRLRLSDWLQVQYMCEAGVRHATSSSEIWGMTGAKVVLPSGRDLRES